MITSKYMNLYSDLALKVLHTYSPGTIIENGTNTLNKSVRERTAGQNTQAAGGLTDSRHFLEVDREYQ